MKKIVQNRLFMTTFVADMLSNFGDVLYYLALVNYVLLLPDAKLAIALVTLSESLPILSNLFMGMWADRTKQKLNMVVATLMFRASLYVLVGLAMGFSPALWVVMVAVGANFLSDMSGQYESALFLPISLRIVPVEEREAMSAFRQGVGSVLRLFFQSSGAILVTWMSYQHLAFFNAGTFLVSLLIMLTIRPRLQALLIENPLKVTEESQSPASGLAGMRQALKDAVAVIGGIPIMKMSILIIAGLNAIFVALAPLFMLSMSENKSFVLINPSATVAGVSIVFAVGSIVGSLLVTTLFKNVSLLTLLRLSVAMPLFLFAGFYMGQIYLIFVVLFATSILLGVFNPKINALVLKEIPEEQLGTVGSGIDTICQVGMIGGQVLTSILVTYFSAKAIAALFFLLAVLLCAYTIKKTYGQSVA